MAKTIPTESQKGGYQDFTLVSKFSFGYRNREDVTVLPPGILVKGSQNVLTNTFQRIGIRKGYTLDGQSNAALAPITTSFDWQTSKGFERNMRSGFLTSAGDDGKLQYRYVDSAGVVTWRDLLIALTSVSFNYTTFWDFTTEKITFMLAVNGDTNIIEWSGGITTLASATSNTITKSGSTTWAEDGFYLAGTRAVTINGTSYTYTGGEDSVTLTGVSPSPVAEPVGSVIHQTPRTTSNSSLTGLPSGLGNDLISNLYNQIYIGSFENGSVYISKVNNYQDYSFATPRAVGEGAIVTVTSPPTAFIPQEGAMYITAGRDEWYETTFTLSSDNVDESLDINRLNTTQQQAAQRQAAVSKTANDVVFLSFEPIINTFGRVSNVVLTPQITDLSFPIVNDMNAYDFTGAALKYFQKFIYIAVPAEGLVLMYNMTDVKNPYWEAPQILPISCFSIIGGALYGHSSEVSESYKLFDGYNNNGEPTDARAVFSFNNYGTRSQSKGYNEFYVEGYIAPNTVLSLGIQYDIDGCATPTTFEIKGNDSQIVCIQAADNSLGKWSFGKQPLGSVIEPQNMVLPPKFRVIKTFSVRYFYEDQISFSTQEIDYQWEIVAFGPQLQNFGSLNNNISQ